MSDRERVIRLIMALRRQGITDARVLSAMERVPRALFVPQAFADQAYEDIALPLECGQTISQPFVVAYMTQALEVGERMRVLEIGTGSGYQSAVLSYLCRRVYTIERYRTLMREAEARFKELALANITTRVGDGARGWPEQAPFDRIILTAAVEATPEALVGQLKPQGVMVLPLGGPQEQWLTRVRLTEQGLKEEALLPVRFVPVVEGAAGDA
jgi:protein-L-isoaspartate(D-aspartate) O-methyltransferase